jgi:tRNA A-37 threonylcarbamoyl transferase component Bud32
VTPERWRQINDLFHRALEREAADREAFLREAARDDPDLLKEVKSLLASHHTQAGFLEEPAWGVAAAMLLEEDSLTGRTIGPYRVLEEIGRGGMGIVYAAEDTRLGRTVALKALPREYSHDPVRRARLTREAKAAAALSHPSIATVFALEELDGNLYLVSELVRGRTLRSEIAEGSLPPGRLLPTLIEIASGLAAAHAAGIVHRDLKPENIVRRSDGQIKILDFGIARSEDPLDRTQSRLTQDGTALGTPGYMAPEQLAGRPVDARADVFAFGVTAWECATGEHPFGTDAAALLQRMTAMLDGRTPADLSRPLPIHGLNIILRRCMRGTPAERYPSGDALLRDLEALAGARVPQAPAEAETGLWWWQFHQAAIAIVTALMPVAGWFVRRWAPRPYGTYVFFALAALATVSVTFRLHLLFTSRVNRAALARQRERTFTSIASVEALLAIVLLIAAALVAGDYDPIAAVLVTLAIVTIASLGVIEPATTAAAGIMERVNWDQERRTQNASATSTDRRGARR